MRESHEGDTVEKVLRGRREAYGPISATVPTETGNRGYDRKERKMAPRRSSAELPEAGYQYPPPARIEALRSIVRSLPEGTISPAFLERLILLHEDDYDEIRGVDAGEVSKELGSFLFGAYVDEISDPISQDAIERAATKKLMHFYWRLPDAGRMIGFKLWIAEKVASLIDPARQPKLAEEAMKWFAAVYGIGRDHQYPRLWDPQWDTLSPRLIFGDERKGVIDLLRRRLEKLEKETKASEAKATLLGWVRERITNPEMPDDIVTLFGIAEVKIGGAQALRSRRFARI